MSIKQLKLGIVNVIFTIYIFLMLVHWKH